MEILPPQKSDVTQSHGAVEEKLLVDDDVAAAVVVIIISSTISSGRRRQRLEQRPEEQVMLVAGIAQALEGGVQDCDSIVVVMRQRPVGRRRRGEDTAEFLGRPFHDDIMMLLKCRCCVMR